MMNCATNGFDDFNAKLRRANGLMTERALALAEDSTKEKLKTIRAAHADFERANARLFDTEIILDAVISELSLVPIFE